MDRLLSFPLDYKTTITQWITYFHFHLNPKLFGGRESFTVYKTTFFQKMKKQLMQFHFKLLSS